MARLTPQSTDLSFYFQVDYPTNPRTVFGFAHPYHAANTSYCTFTNAATGAGPTISFTSTSSPRYLVITSTEASGVLLNISGVDYVRPTVNGTYIKTNGTGSTYWE